MIYENITIILICLAVMLYVFRQPWKKEFEISKASEQVVKKRFAKRNDYPIEKLLDECCITTEIKDRSRFIAKSLNRILGVESNKLRHEDILIDILSVKKTELDKSFFHKWDKAGLGDTVEVFDYDIFEFLEENSVWTKEWITLEQQPNNEGEWINLILSMNVCEILHFFAPLIDE